MALLQSYENQLIIGLNKKIIFIDKNKNKLLKTLELPLTILPTVQEQPEAPDTTNEERAAPIKNEDIKKIQHIKVSPNGKLLAVTTAVQKLLLLYHITGEELVLLSARRISRASSAITFSSDSSKLLVCDKTGDCYLFSCVEYNKPGKWILGHLSMVLDVLFTRDENFIITCDRDEKIRVTKFPDSHKVECYCLGHIEYVSCIQFLPINADKWLVSISGDKTIKIWEYLSGEKVHEFSIPAPGIKAVVRNVNEREDHVAVLVHQPDESIFIYRVRQTESGGFESKLLGSYCFSSKIITDLCYIDDKLFLVTSTDGKIGIEVLRWEKTEYIQEATNELQNLVTQFFSKENIAELEDVTGWFKKKFDNVAEYFERKKRRLDEKNA